MVILSGLSLLSDVFALFTKAVDKIPCFAIAEVARTQKHTVAMCVDFGEHISMVIWSVCLF